MSEGASDSRAEYDTGAGQGLKDGAGGELAEERAWPRGRDMRLLKIEEARTRSDDSF